MLLAGHSLELTRWVLARPGTALVELRAVPGLAIQGTLVRRSFGPLAASSLIAEPVDGDRMYRRHVRSDRAGRFRISLLRPARYVVRYIPAHGDPQALGVIAAGARGIQLVVLPLVRVRGRVVPSRGRTLDGVQTVPPGTIDAAGVFTVDVERSLRELWGHCARARARAHCRRERRRVRRSRDHSDPRRRYAGGGRMDGAYGEDARAIRRFARAPAPSPLEVEQVLAHIVANVRAWLEERDAEAALEDEELALAQSHIVSSRASGAHAHGPDDAPSEHRRLVLSRRKARIDGFDLDGEVAVHEHERDRLEYLCRYVLRPPLALDRPKLFGEQLVCIELEHPRRDGTTHLLMSPSVFLTRLARTKPRVNTALYFGVLAAHSRIAPTSRPSVRLRPRAPTSRA